MVAVHPVDAPLGVQPRQAAVPAKEDGTLDKTPEDGLKVSSLGISSALPRPMHALDTAPAKRGWST